MGRLVSEYLKADEHLLMIQKEFISFLEECDKNGVFCLYYSGNHDCQMRGNFIENASEDIKYFAEIYNIKSIFFPRDFDLIKLNKDLFLTGINSCSDNPNDSNEFISIQIFLEDGELLENPENIIFVSHFPGKEKFSKLGSAGITALKKKYKFRYHYHGHCKNYHNEYKEEGVPTLSVHYDFRNNLKNLSEEDLCEKCKKHAKDYNSALCVECRELLKEEGKNIRKILSKELAHDNGFLIQKNEKTRKAYVKNKYKKELEKNKFIYYSILAKEAFELTKNSKTLFDFDSKR